jgi:streptomycin 6-kinase
LCLHADLHADNVLAAQREPWLAIDPKLYVGDPAYDVTQHIFNGMVLEGADADALSARIAPARSRSRPDSSLALCAGRRGIAVLGRNGRPGPDPFIPS